MSEEWRPVVGWEGIYEVSDRGQVRSVDRIIKHKRYGTVGRKGRVLSKHTRRTGHQNVALCRDGARTTTSVHVLVAEAFLGTRPEGRIVCHIDGDATNNVPGNLYYGTYADNVADAKRHGTWVSAKTHCKHGHEFTAENTRFTPSPTGVWRTCKECNRVRLRELRESRKRDATASHRVDTRQTVG